MDKASKILLFIIIILVIALGVTGCMYIKLNKQVKEYEEVLLSNNATLLKYVEAKENARLELQEENNTFRFVEKTEEI